MKKKILAGCVIALMLGLSACGSKGGSLDSIKIAETTTVKVTTEETTEVTEATTAATEETTEATETTAEETEATTEEATLSPVSLVNITVDDYCNLSGDYADSLGNNYHYSYNLPKVQGVSTAYIDSINTTVAKLYNDYVKSSISDMDQKLSLTVYEITYAYYSDGEVNSIMITVKNDWDMSAFYTFNFDSQGNEITNEKLLERMGIAKNDFTTNISEYTEHLMTDNLDLSNADQDIKDMYEGVIDKTLSSRNISIDMPLYVVGRGRVAAIVTVYSIAGAESYDHICVYNEGYIYESY